MVPTVFLINGLTKGDWLDALLFAVAVAIGLTPEMPPMIVTVNLAKGALAMSRRQVIVTLASWSARSITKSKVRLPSDELG